MRRGLQAHSHGLKLQAHRRAASQRTSPSLSASKASNPAVDPGKRAGVGVERKRE